MTPRFDVQSVKSMSLSHELTCLITQGLLCVLCFSAEAETIDGVDQPVAIAAPMCPLPGAGAAPSIQPLPSTLLGYRLVLNVVLTSNVDTRTAKIGDPVQGTLKDDFRLAGKLYALKNSLVRGHVTSCISPRKMSQSLGSDRRFNSRAALGIQFDEIVDASGVRIPITGALSPQLVTVPGHNSPDREIKVDFDSCIVKGEEVLSDTRRNIYNGARVATFVPIPGTILLDVAATSAVMGVAGAVDPSFAFNKPIDSKINHRRWKGFLYGFFTNLPGAILVQSLVEKGSHIELKSGDQLAVEMRVRACEPPVAFRPFAVAKVQGAVLTRASASTSSSGYMPVNADGLFLQTGKYDVSVAPARRAGIDTNRLILPANGGQRLLPRKDPRLFPCPVRLR